MTNPKEFYRKFDALLSELDQIRGLNLLTEVLTKVINFLGSDLQIKRGFLYEENNETYDLVYSTRSQSYPDVISKSDPVVMLTIKNGCYIFNEPQDMQYSAIFYREDRILAGVSVDGESKKWLLFFQLQPGWEREELQLSLNSIRKIINSRISSQHFKDYIKQAEIIQKSLLPERSPALKGFDIAGKSVPAEIVGGDMYDYLVFDNERIGIAIGDASGHGLPAALLVRDVVTGLRMGIEKHLKITYALEKLNRVIHRSRLSTSFISLFYCEIESNGNLIYTNAGHPSPLLFKNDSIEKFPVGGIVLGPMPEVTLHRGFKELNTGDIVLMFSDGLIERTNSLGEPFEVDRIIEFVKTHRHLSAEQLVDSLIDTAYSFGNEEEWIDDITVVALKKI
ncbi:PP2C family protein-serine/threonine phosphatase [candidate division KSB1 bacterium]|nr:PP2C family protein-serine/threonine phosphatase [candidate division KSB1 bacterium]